MIKYAKEFKMNVKKEFINYFKKKDTLISIESINTNITNCYSSTGMVQFKDILGNTEPKHRTIVTCQKCMSWWKT